MAFTPLVTCHDAMVTFPGADTGTRKDDSRVRHALL